MQTRWWPVLLLLVVLANPQSIDRAAAAESFIVGVNLYVEHQTGDDRVMQQQRITTMLDQRQAAGDNAIIIVFPIYQGSWSASRIERSAARTPADVELRWIIREARARNLTVMLKPLLDEASIVETGPVGAWRGTIEPEEPAEWFASYTELLTDIARLATEERAGWLLLGAELSSLEAPRYSDAWLALVESIGDGTEGTELNLGYSQNWDRVMNHPRWFDELDGLSVSTFFPLNGMHAEASVDDLMEAMEQYGPLLEQVRTTMRGKPVFIGEVGIISRSGMFDAPWSWDLDPSRTLDLDAQRRYFAAACTVYGAHADGLFWWAVFLHDIPEPTQDGGFAFLGKPAEVEANRCSDTWS
jgi:hypothetical protein